MTAHIKLVSAGSGCFEGTFALLVRVMVADLTSDDGQCPDVSVILYGETLPIRGTLTPGFGDDTLRIDSRLIDSDDVQAIVVS